VNNQCPPTWYCSGPGGVCRIFITNGEQCGYTCPPPTCTTV
jgi:hypothetical protein